AGHEGGWTLGEDRDGGYDDLELVLGVALREQSLVLPRDENVPDATLDEADRRSARAGVEDRDVAEQARHELLRARIAPLLLHGVAPGGEVVPPRAAGGLWVRGDDRDAGTAEVLPVLDLLGVPLAHEEDDRRGAGRTVIGKTRLPVRGEQALLGDRVDVVGERERHDVGLEPVDD